MWLQSALLGILATLAAFPLAAAENSSVFITKLGQKNDQYNVTVAIGWSGIPNNTLSFYLCAPASYSWTGFGIGKEMKGSLMFIAYANSKRNNFTLSPRVSTGHSEPNYDKTVRPTLTGNSGIFNGRIVAQGICENCMTWEGGALDVNSTSQPFFYALGPDDIKLNSNAFDAGLGRHERFGQFTLDMVGASDDPASFPGDLSKNRNSTASGGDQDDHDYGSSAHAILMVVAFVILLPFGAAYLKIQNSVMWHWITQSIGVLGILVGTGVGLNVSQEYNRSKHYNSAHQVIGLLVLILILLQWSFGGIHHVILYKKHPHPSILSKVHRFLGPFVILLGVVNSFLGFSFASDHRHIVADGLLVLFVAVLIAGLFFLKSRRDRRKGVFATPAAQNFQSGYVPAEHQSDIPLQQHGAPPAYNQSRPLYT